MVNSFNSMIGSLVGQSVSLSQQAGNLASTGDMTDPRTEFEMSRELQLSTAEIGIAAAVFHAQLTAIQKIADRIG